MVGSAELRKCEHKNKTGGNWENFLFPSPPTFRTPFTFASPALSESLEQAIESRASEQDGIMHAQARGR